jgi:hypothetical protein
MSDLKICSDMGILIRAISHYSMYIFEKIGINKRKYREHLSLKRINPKSMEDHTVILHVAFKYLFPFISIIKELGFRVPSF